MPGPRRQARAHALQLLYLLEQHGYQWDPAVVERFWSHHKVPERTKAYAERLVQAVYADREQVDATLGTVMVSWRLHRVSVVVRNVLRLAVREMAPPFDTPPAVAIDEALELTRDYMDEESARFVNSVLDHYRLKFTEPAPPPAADQEA